MGMTPFQLIYGLNAILPINFLGLALCVAKELECNGHRLSKRIAELKTLDETCLLAIFGIYAKKQQMKQWHD